MNWYSWGSRRAGELDFAGKCTGGRETSRFPDRGAGAGAATVEAPGKWSYLTFLLPKSKVQAFNGCGKPTSSPSTPSLKKKPWGESGLGHRTWARPLALALPGTPSLECNFMLPRSRGPGRWGLPGSFYLYHPLWGSGRGTEGPAWRIPEKSRTFLPPAQLLTPGSWDRNPGGSELKERGALSASPFPNIAPTPHHPP